MTSNFSLKFLAVPAFALSMVPVGIFDLSNGFGLKSHLDNNPPSELASCTQPVQSRSIGRSPHREVLVASAAGLPLGTDIPNKSEEFDFDFSYAESDAAVTLFGCDCPACIGALRQLQDQSYTSQRLSSSRSGSSTANKSLFSKTQAKVNDPVEGHCWVNLQERATEEEIQVVLQTLENEESMVEVKQTF